ncbi:MAG: nucleotidyltransferase family protein [Prevotella sp.]|nr:nucleotidyltransferase family protein [Prevotella sp.]
MKEKQLFFALLRAAMTGEGFVAESFGASPTDALATEAEWTALYRMAKQQSLTGVIYTAVARLAREQQPPMALAMQWASEAETIRGLNSLLNSEAARLTRLFADHGRRSAVLKGQANARLYPDPISRQPGDIDIWMEGGRESVIELLRKMGLVDELARTAFEGKASASYHHVHLLPNEKGVTVEVHFRPSSGNFNPFTNRRLQRWVEQEILQTTVVPEGFNVPSMQFALVMQLAHIQHHFLDDGIGLRQICDYYLLLRNSSEEDRKAVAGLLKRFGLRRTAGALMWLLGEVLHLDDGLMLCETDSLRGEWMLHKVMEGGNFGYYSLTARYGVWQRFFRTRWYRLKMMRFDFWEMFWREVSYWKTIFTTIPERIRYRSLSLRDIRRER